MKVLRCVMVAALFVPTTSVGCKKDLQDSSAYLRQISDAAVSYYEDHGRFPASTGRTPANVPCGTPADREEGGWTNATWVALKFQPPEGHLYSYQFHTSGDGQRPSFTATAWGDADCDGRLTGLVRVATVLANGEIRGGAGFVYHDELD